MEVNKNYFVLEKLYSSLEQTLTKVSKENDFNKESLSTIKNKFNELKQLYSDLEIAHDSLVEYSLEKITTLSDNISILEDTISKLNNDIDYILIKYINEYVSNKLSNYFDDVNIYENINLETNLMIEELNRTYKVNLVWSSNNIKYITNNGVVTRPNYGDKDIVVTLTATVTGDEYIKPMTFNYALNVIQKEIEYQDVLKEVKFDFNPSYITSDVQLPQSIKYSKDGLTYYIDWTSSNPDVLNVNGKVNRQDSDASIKLIATLNGVTLEYDLTVKAELINDSSLFTYRNLGDGSYNKYEITAYTGTRKSIVIPDFHDGIPVTSIANSAFINGLIEEVIIGRNIERIEDYAFYNNRIVSLTIPSNVEKMGAYAFAYNRLTHLTYSAKTIGYQTFAKCSIK